MSLPPPRENQAYCNVSAMIAGHLNMPDEFIISPADPNSINKYPCLSFLLHHSTRKDRFVFDLGFRRDTDKLPTIIQTRLARGVVTTEIPLDVIDSLALGGLTPSDIDHVALSHLHWDHVGNPELFTKATFIVGAECKALQFPGFPDDPNSEFPSSVPPPDRTKYLADEDWSPIGPFRGHDYYGDGSLYIIDSPGHLKGHINVLARTSSDGSWIYLGGDSAHHWHLITGEASIAVGSPWDPHFCLHHDKSKAEEHIANIRSLTKLPRVQVLLAHDFFWYEKNKDGPAFWPGQIPAVSQ